MEKSVGKKKEAADIHELNSTWVVWYHNPSDNNWETNSYDKLFEISTLEDFFMFQNSWRNNLPRLELSMMFMMKKLDNYEYIYPMWEDKNNQMGGCWSFKVNSSNINDVWKKLCFYILSDNVGSTEEVNNTINGISFSPKKGFCIVKIWNSDTNVSDVSNLNSKLGDFMSLGECMYKSHIESIDRDQKKKQKIEDFRNNIDKQEKRKMNKIRYRKNKDNKQSRTNNNYSSTQNSTSYGNNNFGYNSNKNNYRTSTKSFYGNGSSSGSSINRNNYRNSGNSNSNNFANYNERFNTNTKFAWGRKVT